MEEEHKEAMRFVNPKMWSSKQMETVTVGLMQINRNRDAAVRSLDDAVSTDSLKLIIQGNMENAATQARAGWAATNRIDSLIEPMETLHKTVGDNVNTVNKSFDEIRTWKNMDKATATKSELNKMKT